jgi:hypothetical protein
MPTHRKYLFLCLVAVGAGSELARAQPVAAPARELGPGVIITIRDVLADHETIDPPRKFTELFKAVTPQAWKPNSAPTTQTLLEKASRVTFHRDVWSLEFNFKPLRVVNIDGIDVWYLVYFVRNNGETRSPKLAVGSKLQVEGTTRPVTFVPTFILRSNGLRQERYDRVLPEALRVIAAKERVPGILHDSKSIAAKPIPVSSESADEGVWGVAMWDRIDPRTDFISVFVQGLTNAYRLQPSQDADNPTLLTKTLQLNFWRSGDEIRLSEKEIEFGLPLYPDEPLRQQQALDTYGMKKPLDYLWVFR